MNTPAPKLYSQKKCLKILRLVPACRPDRDGHLIRVAPLWPYFSIEIHTHLHFVFQKCQATSGQRLPSRPRPRLQARLEGLDPGCVEPTALEFIDACGVACTHDEGDPVWTWSRDRFPVIVKVSCESAGTLPPADLVSKGRGRARWQDTLVGPPLRGDSHTVVMLVSMGSETCTNELWIV